MSIFRILILALLAQNVAAQQPRPASVEGIVTKTGGGEPIAKAVVALAGTVGSDSYTATAAADGKFAFANVVPGRYRLTVTRNGYLNSEYGQRGPNGTGSALTVTAGQEVKNVRLSMTAAAAISGRIYDSDGEPVVNMAVQALKYSYAAGQRRLSPIKFAQTDDRGEYRLFWLPPGQYYISATPADISASAVHISLSPSGAAGSNMVLAGTLGGIITASSGPSFVSADNAKGERYAPVYFPGTADPQRAVAIDLRPGADYSGVDFTLRRVRTRRLRGIVIDGSTGRPANGASVWLAPRNTGASGNLGNGHADSNGEFSIDGVLPGSYFLIAFPASRSPGRWLGGRTAMEVGDADLERLSVVLMPSVEIAGQLVIEGRENTADEVHPVIALYSQTQNVPFLSQTLFASFSGNRARAFTIDNAVEGDYDVRLEALQPDQYVKSIRFGGVDVLNGGLHLDPRAAGRLEVILGVDAGGLEGAVVNGNHERVANVRVALVPDAARRERADLFKSVSTDDAGQFRIQGIAPGDYTVFGWEDIEDGVWRDPEFIRKFEGRGTLIHVDGVSKQSIELLLLTVS